MIHNHLRTPITLVVVDDIKIGKSIGGEPHIVYREKKPTSVGLVAIARCSAEFNTDSIFLRKNKRTV